MILSLLLGLTGSLGHCSGMCSGIVLLLQRSIGPQRSAAAWGMVHTGRLLAYAALGPAAGALGDALSGVFERFELAQGAAAFYTALIGFYFVLVLLGLAPSPELLFPGLVASWRRFFQKMNNGTRPGLLAVGFAWGLLPCGLVLTALFTAAVTASPPLAALRMAVFGLGTLPVLLAAGLISNKIRASIWPRYGAAAVLAVFSLQIGLRGFAAFGLIEHMMLGKVMLW